MKLVEIASLKPPSGGSPRFIGADHDASVSFFVVNSAPGRGADKHRHPYEEVFVVLDGLIEVINDGVMQTVGGGNIVIIPANTWHEFKNRADHNALMVNIHPSPQMIQENWADLYPESGS